ncbi:MAG: hypothetical protein KDD47_12050, partial [Acidobacteria bacterium]|nr:hypothetical protein [Acidobacteriota bacterium]
MHARSSRVPSFLLLLVLAVTGASAETFEIGTLGASFETGKWERRSFSQDLGEDQFLLVGGGSFLVFLESFDLYQRRSDFVDKLDEFTTGVESSLEDIEIDPELGFERYEELSRATRRFQAKIGGLELAYQLDLVSAGDGVGYLLLSWTAASNAQRLYSGLDEVVESLSLPGPESEWFAKSQPSVHRYGFAAWEVEMTFCDSVFSEAESKPQKRYSLQGGEG